jgi:hypothetical protein
VLLLFAITAGCAVHRTVRGKGTIHLVTTEGGFWTIQGDDGNVYDPIHGISPEYQQEGLRVRFEAEYQPDAMSTHMAGTMVEITKLQRL